MRQFCLDTIAEAFGYGYRPDWHDDLDRLGSGDDDYAPERGGGFLVIRHRDEVVACGGMRSLATRPNLCERFAERYPRPDCIASLWRVYVNASHRSQGLGCVLTRQLEELAASRGYTASYLHTSAARPASVAFWTSRGYRVFGHDPDCPDATVHMDRPLHRPAV